MKILERLLLALDENLVVKSTDRELAYRSSEPGAALEQLDCGIVGRLVAQSSLGFDDGGVRFVDLPDEARQPVEPFARQ